MATRYARPRAYAGTRIETKDGRCGTILSTFAGPDRSWFVALDVRHDRGETEPEPAWVKRRDFYLLGEEARPW